MKLTNWSISHSVSIYVLILVLSIAGWISYQALPRENFPDVEIPFVLVTTSYFGVSPSDIETLITNPIEDELEQLSDVREIRSTSAESASIISIEFEPEQEIDTVLQDVRERVNAAEPDLPDDAEAPVVSEISISDLPIMIVNISGDIGLVTLKRIGEAMQDEIESIPGVLEARLTGGLEREIAVEADPVLLEYYRVSLMEIMGAIQLANLNLPGGSIDVGDVRYLVRVPAEFDASRELGNLVIREEEGQPIRIRDVAQVVDAYADAETYARMDGVESVSLSISRRTGENILEITETIHELVARYEAETDGVTFTVMGDVSDDIRMQLNELENNILTGLILVVLVLFFFMGGFRNAFFVATAIPLSMLISFSVISAMGVTLNMVVLFSLVLALGMLVDNAIVIVENIYRHGAMGKSRVQAAQDGVAEVAWPVIASTATTVFAFLPLVFWTGIMGQFMYYLPLTVIVVLSSSLFVALVINPVLAATMMKMPKTTSEDELDAIPDNFIYKLYGGTLRFAVRQRWLVVVIATGAFFGTFVLFGKYNAGVEFFPSTTPETAYVNVVLPDGSRVEASDRVVRQVEAYLETIDDISHMTAGVGAGTGGAMDFGGGGAPHESQVTIDFLGVDDRSQSPLATIEEIRAQLATIPGIEYEIAVEEGGPPSGPPVNIEIAGDEMVQMTVLTQQVIDAIEDIPGLVNLQDDLAAGRPEVSILLDREAVADYGISAMTVADTVRTAISGATATVLREANDEYDVVVRLQDLDRDSFDDLERLSISIEEGERVPLTALTEIVVQQGAGNIQHVDGARVITITGDTADGYNDIEVLAAVQEAIAANVVVPRGYEIDYTGQNQEQAEAQAFLGTALMIALGLIALVLITQFNSVLQPGIIMASATLSLLGVLWILMIRQLPFTIIMTGIGIISLAGVVVNNAIVLIDYINQLVERGLHHKEAVVQAGLVRFRPVMLTTITTMLSLMPTVLGYALDVKNLRITKGGMSVEMWGPMANAVVAGLAVATMLTLIVVPVLYSIAASQAEIFGRLFRRRQVATAAGPMDIEIPINELEVDPAPMAAAAATEVEPEASTEVETASESGEADTPETEAPAGDEPEAQS